mmetsp:Transcript_88721/g.147366  ORF Transcript_88721/g.147366 Transcript_88721/m.147366 type:complete len:110 (-) Transcript_88721:821-1150(-)
MVYFFSLHLFFVMADAPKKTIYDLFPNLTADEIERAVDNCGGNEIEAIDFLGGAPSMPDGADSRRRSICSMFPNMNRDQIQRALDNCSGNEATAISLLKEQQAQQEEGQ